MPAKDFFVESQRRGIACGAVFSPDEALDDEHFQSREYPVNVDHPELGRSYTYPGLPFTGAEIPRSIRRAPLVGEHTDEVLAELGDDNPLD
jgi:crotonobetainyl-CoA:carnitine CoA-transferase CaiB-like acyl-CoA transferase